MKTLFAVLIPLMAFLSCSRETPVLNTFREPADPDSVIFSATWADCSPGLHAGFASLDVRFPRSAMPGNDLMDSVSLSGWKGERINAQLVLWSAEDISRIKVVAGKLQGADGSMLDTSMIQVRPLGFVLTDAFLSGCGKRDKDTIPAHLSADLLHHPGTFGLPGKTVRPVWVTVNIPRHLPSGYYSGNIKILTPADTLALPYSVYIQNRVLPPPAEWSFHLDLWQNPFAIARVHQVPLWSDEHWSLISRYLAMLADAGQKCITVSIVERPWNGQTYDPFQSLIGWIHNTSGKWDYDYSLFDQYVETARSAGITQQINCYTMVPWGNRFSWFEEDSARQITRILEPGSEDYRALWQPFLWDFREHLRERGWLSITTIAMDERSHDQMQAQLDFIRTTAPEFGITLAGHYYPDLMPQIRDFSFNWNLIGQADREMLIGRKKEGLKTTFYVACGIPAPNTFTFSPPAEAEYLGWVAAAYGFDGFLRWAYNSWPEDPLTDSRFRTWPAGDTYLVYPGPSSSVRFERLRDGIETFEKIRILTGNMSTRIPKLEHFFDKVRAAENAQSFATFLKEGNFLVDSLSLNL